jgi:GNAT superfamily N-acetyltransferase
MNDSGAGRDSGGSVVSLPGAEQIGIAGNAPVPPGKLEMVVTSLQMLAPPLPGGVRSRAEPLAIIRARRPTVSFYRYLYQAVGEDWMWFERRRLRDDELAAIIGDPAVAVYVLYVDGTPAGYAELDSRVSGEVELAYFGLMPEFIGRGLGRYLLHWAVERAWSEDPRRVWVHTCNFDDPGALALYQKGGFVPFLQERQIIDDPRLPEG